jgi:amino acid adenylation domain-containing protein/thioester reductase-like protein
MTEPSDRLTGLSPDEKRELLARLLRGKGADPRAPLSLEQQRVWFLERLAPGNPVHHLASALRLRGQLDTAALASAGAEVARRQESLRTAFVTLEGRPFRVVAPEVALPLQEIDLRDLAAGEREAEAARRAREEARRPFDLAQAPLARLTLLRLAEDDHLLVLTLHRMIADDASATICLRDLAAAYGALAGGRPSPLAPVARQYADFALEQRQRWQGEELEAQLAWWRTELAGVPALELPADAPRPAAPSFAGAALPFALPAELAAELRTLSRRESATLFMTLLAAFQALLFRWSGQEDLCVGTPERNRSHSSVAEVIGPFANRLPLRIALAGDPTFRELLGRVRQVCLGALEHRELPFERLVQDLQPERDRSRSPIFQALFSLDEEPLRPPTFPGLSLTPAAVDLGATEMDLALTLADSVGALGGILVYSTDLFTAGTARGLVDRLHVLLDGLATDPGRRLSELPLLTAAERRRLLVEWNDTAADVPADAAVHRLIAARARETPDALAVAGGDRELTYATLDRRANHLAIRLRERGVGPEVRVAVCFERSVDLVVALLGALKAGGAYLPLDPASPQGRTAFLLDDSDARLVVTRERLAGGFRALGADILTLGADAPEAAEPPAGEIAPESTAYVLYTSGSTGRPKGVCVSHRNLAASTLARLRFYRRELGDEPGRFLLLSPFVFDSSVAGLFGTLCEGGALIVPPDGVHADPAALAELIERRGVTRTLTLPSFWQQILTPGRAGELRSLAAVIVAGEACPPELLAQHRELLPGAALFNEYGPTEGTVWSTVHRFTAIPPAATARVPIGRPIENARAYVVDAHLQPAPAGFPGELLVGGAGVARSYLGRPDLTAERFIPDPFAAEPGARLYRTGDLVRFLPDGALEFLGRVDHQVKIRGHRIELGEIEALLGRHPNLREAVAVVREDAPGDRRLVAYAVPREQPGPTIPELRRHLQDRLPDFMVPSAFVLLESLPCTASGKVDRKALPAPDRARPEVESHYQAPRNREEEVLAGIFAEVLGVDRVGIQDSFFELGGHSMLFAQLFYRVLQDLKVEVPVEFFFQAPTVAGIARALEVVRQGGRTAAVDAVRGAGGGEEPAPDTAAALARALRREMGEPGAPLSAAQQRWWFLAQSAPADPVAERCAAVRLRGPLDAEALAQASAEIARRHEILRTVFPAAEGRPYPSVVPDLAPRPAMIDLRTFPAAGREAEAARRAAEEVLRPFDIAQGPLVRLALLRLDESDHLLILAAHRLVADEASLALFLREMAALSAAFAAGQTSPLPPPLLQHVDVAREEQQRWRGPDQLPLLSFWRTRLAGLMDLRLPTDQPRPAGALGARSAALPVTLPADVVGALRELGGREDADLFTVLLAGLQTLLFRSTHQEDIAVATPASGRTRPELADVIGPLDHRLVLRSSLTGDLRFRDLLGDVRAACREAFAHRDLPFDRLVVDLAPEEALDPAALARVALELAPAPESLVAGGLLLEPAEIHGATELDLSLKLAESGDGLGGTLVYSAGLFEEETAARLLEHLRELLAGAAAHPEQRLDALPLLSMAERDQLLGWNATRAEVPSEACLHELIAVRAAQSPDAPAVVGPEETLTFGELVERSHRLARALRRRGVGPEVRVGLCAERSPELAVGLLGVLAAGGAYVPLDPGYPRERLAYMVEDAGLGFVLTQERLAERLPASAVEMILLETSEGALDTQSAGPPASGVTPDNLAYVIYTSGSTGRPKGAMISHRGLVNYLFWAVRSYAVDEGQGAPVHSPIGFDLTVTSLFAPLLAGRPTVLLPEDEGIDTLGNALRAGKDYSFVKLTPAHLELLAHRLPAGEAAGRARALILGGEALTGEALAFWRSHAPQTRLINEYGPTETVVGCCVYEVPAGDVPAGPVPIGLPIANLEIHLVDAGLRPVPIGVPGELVIGGVGLGRGYLGRPDLTAERFVPSPFGGEPGARLYRTGDLARRRSDGHVVFLGRIDHQVKIRGYRIELGEIETALRRHPGLRDAVVVAREGEPGDRRLVAYVVVLREPVPRVTELRGFLQETLPDYMIPAAFVLLDALPLTPNGKVDRRALPVPDRGRPDLESPFAPPRTPVERELARVWAQVLGLDQVGIHDNFFELGGDSLLVAQLFAGVYDALDVEVPADFFFEAPTVADVARAIEIQRQGGRTALMEAIRGIDLESEAVLDPAIWPEGAPVEEVDNPSAVFLTGPTGFLGAFLLYEMLEQTDADVYCLVRAADDEEAFDRLRRTLRKYLIWDERRSGRIKAVAGDLAKPLLGLAPERFQELAETVEVIVHNGALVNFVYPYSVHKAPNVLGTQEVLRLACRVRCKPVHYVSTMDVFFRRTGENRLFREDDPLPTSAELYPDGYIQSKWVAEKLMVIARDRGVPANLYRPRVMMGQSETGVFHETDAMYLTIKGCLQLGLVSDLDMHVNVMPIDYVSRAIVHIARQKRLHNRVFHFANPQAIRLSELVRWARDFGWDVRQVPFQEWRAAALRVGPDNAMYSLVPLIPDVPSPEELNPMIDCTNTREGIAGTSIACPRVDDRLLEIWARRLIETGFLEPPAGRAPRSAGAAAGNGKGYLSFAEDRYREIFEVRGSQEVMHRIWRDAYEDDYPEELDPFGFVTRADLRRMREALAVAPGGLLVDVGCGKGGPGLWLARELGARLLGLDILEGAIEQARELASRFALPHRPDFRVGSFTATGLPDAAADAALGVDSFWMVTDKAAGLREMARVLRPGARFVFTVWALPAPDYPSLLEQNGFRVLEHAETPRWKERQLAVYRGILEHEEELRRTLGSAADILVSEARHAPVMLAGAPRVLIVAERR